MQRLPTAAQADSHLDHVVVATRDLRRTIVGISTFLGVEPIRGVVHSGRGTLNYLLGLGSEAYLEIIGIDESQDAVEAPRLFGLDHAVWPSRLVAWAIEPEDFDETLKMATSAGIDLGSVSELKRATARGHNSVRITERADVDVDGVLPFLVDRGKGPKPGASLPAVDLVALRATHPDPARIARQLDAIGVHLDLWWGVTPALEIVVDSPNGILSLR